MTGVPSWLNVRPSKGAAFAIHLILSLAIFSSLVAVMLVYWFPGDLFFMDGGWEGLKLVAMVDLVLGPALTLILFKPGKPGLKLDLSMIAAVQIAALAYGFYATYNQRTMAVVFAETEFATVSAKDKREADKELLALDISPKPIPDSTAFTVPLLLTPAAENFGEYMAQVLNGYPSAHMRNDQYVNLDGQHDDMQRHMYTAERLEEEGILTPILNALSKHDRKLDDVEIYRFRARYSNGFALYDPEHSRIIDYVSSKTVKSDNNVAENG